MKLKRKLLKGLAVYTEDQIWEAVVKRKEASGQDEDGFPDLREPEWEVFSDPDPSLNSRDFKLRVVEPPEAYRKVLTKVVLAERLREVRALTGFTRIESPGDYTEIGDFPKDQRVPLGRKAPKWVPTSEIRGEGVFLQFSEQAIEAWVKKTREREGEFFEAHERWRKNRGLEPDDGFPTMRYVLLHSLAHALIRQFAIECGYTTASIRERIYSRPPGGDGEPMAGVLLYTAAPDSEGTLGGLVALGDPKALGRHLDQALEAMTALRLRPPLCRAPPDQGRADAPRGGLPRLPVPARDLVRAGQQVPRPLGAGLHRRVGRPGVLHRLRRGRPRGDDHRRDRRVGHASEAGGDGPQRDRRTRGPLRRAVSGVRAVVGRSGGCRCPRSGSSCRTSKGRVCAHAELAWPRTKVAAVLPEGGDQRPEFEQRGWTVLDATDLCRPRDGVAVAPGGVTSMPTVALSDGFLDVVRPAVGRARRRKSGSSSGSSGPTRRRTPSTTSGSRATGTHHVRTVRIDQKYRAVVLHPDEGDVYVLMWVDDHDEAMDWAEAPGLRGQPPHRGPSGLSASRRSTQAVPAETEGTDRAGAAGVGR